MREFSGNNNTPEAVLHASSGRLEETATVVGIEGRWALLAIERRTSCGACAAGGECGTSVLARLLGKRKTLLRIPNDFDAQVGERIIIGIIESALLKASFLAYFIPVAGMISGALLALPLGFGDFGAVIFSLLGLAIGLVYSRRRSNSSPESPLFRPAFICRSFPSPISNRISDSGRQATTKS